jgi:hypothetical protein
MIRRCQRLGVTTGLFFTPPPKHCPLEKKNEKKEKSW